MPIVDLEASTRVGWSPVDVAAAYLRGGARCLQIRGKTASGAAYLDLAQRIVALARAGEAVVVVNDRAEIAALAHADGVHVGQTDLAPALIRRIVGDRSIVGLSTHTTAQLAVAVAEPVTYVAIGPVFSTATKSTGYEA